MTLRVPSGPSLGLVLSLRSTTAPSRIHHAERAPPVDMVWLSHDLGSCPWDVDHAGCKRVVTLHSLEEPDISGKTLAEALAKCLLWPMEPE
jgi:hypothetical protein